MIISSYQTLETKLGATSIVFSHQNNGIVNLSLEIERIVDTTSSNDQ